MPRSRKKSRSLQRGMGGSSPIFQELFKSLPMFSSASASTLRPVRFNPNTSLLVHDEDKLATKHSEEVSLQFMAEC